MATRPARVVEAERRQLTVLFCDLVGSTALSQRLDPEDLREIIRRYQSCTAEVIERYDGYTARYLGDGILVYFGYPRAHEDDAARALHTGLDLVEAVSRLPPLPGRHDIEPLRVRIGVATGLVVVGDVVGERASEQAVAVGQTPNLAARMQALAEPNTFVAAAATRELAGDAFEFGDLGQHRLGGFHEPVQAWRVVRERPLARRFDAVRNRTLTPLVGRRDETAALVAHWTAATRGHDAFVLLEGDAGIGKSRLVEALCERIGAAPHERIVMQCSPYHANSALYPFIDELARAAGLRLDDDGSAKLAKLATLVDAWPFATVETLPLAAELLSLPLPQGRAALRLTPQQQKDQTLAILRDRFVALASRKPLLLVIEDLHWIDPTSSELVAMLARCAASCAMLFVATSRVRNEPAGFDAIASMRLAVGRLPREETLAMARLLAGNTGLSEDAIEAIAARSDGVPLFVEEVAKAVSVTGTEAVQSRVPERGVPVTLSDLLMAQLDPLGDAKEVAQVGAVIGREFTRRLLCAILGEDRSLDAAVERLVASGIVFHAGEPGRDVFVFKHALLQDAAYESLLRSRRQQVHSRIAEVLLEDDASGAKTQPEVVAHHRTQAGEWLPAAKLWALAAQRALDRSANLEALAHAGKGVDVVRQAPPSGLRDALELALEILRGAAYRAVSGFSSSVAERCFARARDLAGDLGDVPRLIDARRGLFSCYYARGALALARDEGVEVLRLGERMNEPGSRMLGHWMVGCMMFWQGEFEAARAELERAFELYDPGVQRAKTLALQIDPGVNALLHTTWLKWILGFPDQARATSAQAVETARRLDQPFAVAMALFFASTTHACCGDRERVAPLLDELFAITSEHKLRYLGSCAFVLRAQEAIADGRCEAGLLDIRRAFDEFRAQEAGVGFPWVMSIAATAHLALGNVDTAAGTVDNALASIARNGERHWEAELWRLRGEILARRGDVDGARMAISNALATAQRQSARSFALRAATSLSRLPAPDDDARRVLQQAIDALGEGFDTADARSARAALR